MWFHSQGSFVHMCRLFLCPPPDPLPLNDFSTRQKVDVAYAFWNSIDFCSQSVSELSGSTRSGQKDAKTSQANTKISHHAASNCLLSCGSPMCCVWRYPSHCAFAFNKWENRLKLRVYCLPLSMSSHRWTGLACRMNFTALIVLIWRGAVIQSIKNSSVW